MVPRTCLLPVVVSALACSKSTEPSRAPPTQADPARPTTASPPEAATIASGRPGGETDEQLRQEVEALEEAYQRGEGSWYRSAGHDLVVIGKDGATRKQPFPLPKHDHGDRVSDLYLAPDGTLFAAGYAYTGAPGPDTGAIHRMTPGGKIARVFDLPERELYAIWGRSANDVYAVGPKIVVHWDGNAWTEVDTAGVVGTINSVSGTANDLWIQAVENNPGEIGRIYRRTGTTWKLEIEIPCVLRNLDAADKVLYSAGACNAVLRRGPDGAWKVERMARGGAYEVAAVSDTVAYLAAEELLVREPDGTWAPVDAGFPRIHSVFRGPKNDVFVAGNFEAVGGASGVARGAGDRWTRLPVEDCEQVASTGDVTYCTIERRISVKPKPD